MRGVIALAVVALHVVLLLLLVSGLRLRIPGRHDPPVFVGILVLPTVRELPPVPRPSAPVASVRAREVTASESLAPVAPGEAIEPAPSVRIDWASEAAQAARRAREPDHDPAAEFTAAPQKLREPCKPRETHMEWNGKEDRRFGMAGILPYVKLGKCVVSLGFFGCPVGEEPEANGHILDDMKDPTRPRSSVPDALNCE